MNTKLFNSLSLSLSVYLSLYLSIFLSLFFSVSAIVFIGMTVQYNITQALKQ